MASSQASQSRYYRHVAEVVLSWYLELGSGVARIGDPSLGGDVASEVFHDGLLNFKLDVESALSTLSRQELRVLLAIHRDGLSFPDATRLAGIQAHRPDSYVATLEVRIGREFERRKLSNISDYMS